jgi:hypothetical protein
MTVDRRLTQMNADECHGVHPRSSAFIGGDSILAEKTA